MVRKAMVGFGIFVYAWQILSSDLDSVTSWSSRLLNLYPMISKLRPSFWNSASLFLHVRRRKCPSVKTLNQDSIMGHGSLENFLIDNSHKIFWLGEVSAHTVGKPETRHFFYALSSACAKPRLHLVSTVNQRGVTVLTTLGKRALENMVGKGENAGIQHFLLLPQCFLP